MGPILHLVFALACLVAGVVLVCTGHIDQAYIVWGGAGLGAYGFAAQTSGGGGAGGLDLAGMLKLASHAMSQAGAQEATVREGHVSVVPPPEAPAPPPAAPPLSAP